jgi:hypothetical protein
MKDATECAGGWNRRLQGLVFAPSRFGLKAEGMTDLSQHGHNDVAEIAVVVIAVVQIKHG